jgi:pimeloyl-ACP methyl ester carboxylesterase
MDVPWELPGRAPWMETLGERFRVIHFDKGGVGLSDPASAPDLETRMDDLRAVLDAVGSERAVLLGEGADGGGLTGTFPGSPRRLPT